MGIKVKRYFLLAVILLLLLGVSLTIGLISSRRIMLDLIKEQARSFLSVVASTQENLIFAEARLEDEYIEKLIGACHFLDARLSENAVHHIQQSFDFSSVVVFDRKTRRRLAGAGTPIDIPDGIFDQTNPISFGYFDFGNKKLMRFVYIVAQRVYQIEAPAEEIQEFRTEFGFNKIMNQIAVNPMVDYLVLQDKKGILFATPNVQTVSKIDDDPTLLSVVEQRIEASRIEKFGEQDVLELVRPFVVDEELLGIFRIGISLESYHGHVRKTEGQLITLFVILFGAGFILFLLFMNYQSYANIKELFDKTLGAVEDGVLLVDKKKVIGGANAAFCSLSAFDECRLVGSKYQAVFPGDPFDLNRVITDGRKFADEKTMFGRAIQYATYPLFDERQRVSGVISILHDISKIREFEKEREEAERLVFLGNLVANFAHEIKNPLNGLSIATQRMIKEFPSKDREYTRITKNLKIEIDALNKIVNDFLLLARPRMKERVEFKLSKVLEETCASITEQVREFDITLTKSIADDATIIGSPDDFRRAILNILLNAIDAVTTVDDRKRRIDVSTTGSKDKTVLRISDTGLGMDKEEKARVFSPYFTTKKSGTGLGLYIAQKIIRDHDGKIEIESEKGKGTTFVIGFPL
jgi:signal transduction histidine kinase